MHNEELNTGKIRVLKRKGVFEDLMPEKIKAMAEYLTKGTECDPNVLVENVKHSLFDGITTEFIHKQMTFDAVNLITPQEPEWRLVAGRSLTVENIKNINVEVRRLFKRPEFEIDRCKFTDFLQLMHKQYNQSWFVRFNADYLNDLADKIIKFERNFDYFIESVITTEQKFLMKFETAQHLYFVISLIYAQTYFSRRKMKLNDNLALFEAKLERYYELISTKKISFPSVILSELRKPNANLASCFIVQFPDSLDKIMDVIKDCATISKNGGGIGANLDHIRAFKSWLMNIKGKATGIKPLMKVLNDLMLYVNQCHHKDSHVKRLKSVSINGEIFEVMNDVSKKSYIVMNNEKIFIDTLVQNGIQ